MATEHCHKSSVCKELGTGLLTALIGSLEGVIAAIQNRVWNLEVGLCAVLCLVVATGCMLKAAPEIIDCNLHCLYIPFRDKNRLWMLSWRISRT